MSGLVLLLALLGGVALVRRAVRAAARLALRAAEVAATSGMAEVSARRGDLTGMVERQAAERAARAARRQALLTTAGWTLWLVVPLVLGWGREAYALAAVLWLLPAAPTRPTAPRRADSEP